MCTAAAAVDVTVDAARCAFVDALEVSASSRVLTHTKLTFDVEENGSSAEDQCDYHYDGEQHFS